MRDEEVVQRQQRLASCPGPRRLLERQRSFETFPHSRHVDLAAHEVHLVDAHVERVVDPVDERSLAAVPPAIEVAAPVLVGRLEERLVAFLGTREAAQR